MERVLAKHRITVLVGACLLAVALIVPLQAGAAQGAPPQPKPIPAHDFGTWSYTAGREDDGALVIHVRYDDRSIAGLRAYATANRTLAQQLAREGGQAEVQITFRAPVSPDEFRTWAASTGLKVKTVTLRTVEGDGRRSTLGVHPQATDPLPQAAIDRRLASVSQTQRSGKLIGPLTVQGVITVTASVDAKRLPSIAGDPRVFLADVTPAVTRRALTTAGVSDAARGTVFVKPPFWQMEDLGLDNFR